MFTFRSADPSAVIESVLIDGRPISQWTIDSSGMVWIPNFPTGSRVDAVLADGRTLTFL